MKNKQIILLLAVTVFAMPNIAQELTQNNAQSWYAQYKDYFNDDVCSELKPDYKEMSDDDLRATMSNLPEKLIEFALKAKNNTWDGFEKDFRVQKFKPYSKSLNWAGYMNVYQYSELQNPTGIIGSNEYIYVFVSDEVPDSIWLSIGIVADNMSYSLMSYKVFPGLNMFKMPDTGDEKRMMFLNYTVDTDTTATSKKLSDYPEVTLHIEGGHVCGYFDASRHDNDFWREMIERQQNDPISLAYKGIQVKGERVLFHMFRNSLVNACPNNIKEAIELWDETVRRQHRLMGAEQYYDRWNDLIMARSDNKGGGFYASPTFTYFDDYALPDMLSPDAIKANPGILWTSAHEIGHVNQGAINMVGCTESSNNLFANMNVHLIGKSTTRGDGVAFNAGEFLKRSPFPLRTSNPIAVSRLYFQLYLYFHAAKKDVTFYPRLFEALRKDRIAKGYITYAKDDQLKFAEKCCEIAQMDLSEFFEAWGFFEPMESLNVGDYSTYLVTLTNEEIEASRARMQQYTKKGGHLMFIEDRIKPSPREDGVAGNRVDYNDEFKIGTMGKVGQWGDYMDESVKATGYYYAAKGNVMQIYTAKNANGALGFKLYNATTGKLLSYSNTYEIAIPETELGNELKVVAAQADGTDYIIPSVDESDDEEMAKMALDALITSTKKYSLYTTTTGDKVGYYYADVVKEFKTIYNKAKKAVNNNDTTEHSFKEWAKLLKDAQKAIDENPNAFVKIDEANAHKLENIEGYNFLCNDAMGVKGVSYIDDVTDKNNAYWVAEYTGEGDYYYIRDNNGYYINDIVTIGAYCNGKRFDDAVEFRLIYNSDCTLSFQAKESNLYLAINSENMAVGTEALNENAMWLVTVAAKNMTAIEVVEEEKGESVLYDLQGRKVTNPGKGIYIKNGEKRIY